MAERRQAAVPARAVKTAEPTAGDVLEKDALDRSPRRRTQDLVELRLLQRRHVM
jgi:hypothetical protein